MHALALGLVVTLALPAQELGDPTQVGDPNDVQVVIDDMGNVGIRIADAQAIAETVMTGFSKRIGHQAVVYEGLYKSAKQMKRMLGPNSETQIQDDRIAFYEEAIKKAKHRVRVRFGKKGKRKHWVTVSCRENGKRPKDALESKRFTGPSFRDVRAQVKEAMPTFCAAVKKAEPKEAAEKKDDRPSAEELAEKRRKERLKKWQPPPMRN